MNRRAAQFRLREWGRVLRAMTYWGCPHMVPYHRQPFIHGRIGPETIGRMMDHDDRFARALVVDEVLMVARDISPHWLTAIVIRYVEVEGGHMIDSIRQVMIWHQRTNLGRTQYYCRLREAEDYVRRAL